MDTKICPNCNQINPVQQSFCHSCGKPFANAVPNNFSGQPNFQNQQNYNQPNYAQPNNFQQPNYNPPNNFQQPKKSGNKAMWWVIGGVIGVLIIGFIGLVGIGFIVAAVSNSENASIEGTKWRSASSATVIFGINNRYTETSQNGSASVNGDLKIYGNQLTIKLDGATGTSSYKWRITGNKLTLVDNLTKGTDVFTRIE